MLVLTIKAIRVMPQTMLLVQLRSENPLLIRVHSNNELLLQPPVFRTKKTSGKKSFCGCSPSTLEQITEFYKGS